MPGLRARLAGLPAWVDATVAALLVPPTGVALALSLVEPPAAAWLAPAVFAVGSACLAGWVALFPTEAEAQ